eukprot:3636675-Pyramimonas_sp.AAC.1
MSMWAAKNALWTKKECPGRFKGGGVPRIGAGTVRGPADRERRGPLGAVLKSSGIVIGALAQTFQGPDT